MSITNLNNTNSSWGSEYSLPRAAAYSSGSPQSSRGEIEIELDLSAMAAGDNYTVKVYRRINGTARATSFPLIGAYGTEPWTSPRFKIGEDWDVTLICNSGTNTRAIAWSIQVEASGDATAASQTTIATAIVAIQADTDDIQTRLPAALVSGRIDASVGAMAANVVTATAINAAAITAAKFATDAIDANALKADAVTEIQAGLATAAAQTTLATAVAAIQSDTDDIQTRLPAALVGGRMDSSTGAMVTGVLTAIQSGLATASSQTTIVAGIAAVQSDTDDIQTRLPAALVGGRIDASVGAMAANVVTATAIATDAIDADALANDAVTELQSGLATSASQSTLAAGIAAVQSDTDDIQARLPAALVAGRMDASVGAMAANTLTASAIAASAITASKVATDAIGAAQLAADAVTEIQSGLATATTQTSLAAAVAAVQADTDDIQTRLPTSLSSGRMRAAVEAMAADTVTASAAASDFIAEVQAGLALSTQVDALEGDTASLLSRLSAVRAGYLDYLNVGGLVASSAEATAIQNNTRVVRVVPNIIQLPDSGTTVHRVELFIYDDVGNMEAPDAAPTITLLNQSGTDRSSRLNSTTMALVSTGYYRAIYTADTAHPVEQLMWTFSVTENAVTRLYGNTTDVVAAIVTSFTTTDRTKLNRIDADYTTARADKLDYLDAAITSRPTADQIDTTLSGTHGMGAWGGGGGASASSVANAVWNALLANYTIAGSMGEAVALVLGLSQGNYVIDQANHGTDGQLSARIRLFHNGSDVSAASDGGTSEGEFASFVAITEYIAPNKIKIHRVARS